MMTKNENMCVLSINEIVKKLKREDQILYELQKITEFYNINGITSYKLPDKYGFNVPYENIQVIELRDGIITKSNVSLIVKFLLEFSNLKKIILSNVVSLEVDLIKLYNENCEDYNGIEDKKYYALDVKKCLSMINQADLLKLNLEEQLNKTIDIHMCCNYEIDCKDVIRISLKFETISASKSEKVSQVLKLFPNLKEIQLFTICCSDLSWIPQSLQLESVCIKNCNIRNFNGIQNFYNIKHLLLRNSPFESTKNMMLLSKLKNLKILQVYWCTVKSWDFLEKMRSLQQLYAAGFCVDMINNLNMLKNLSVLYISNVDLCGAGEFIGKIDELNNLEYIEIKTRNSFDINFLMNYPKLKCAVISEKCIVNPECISKYREVLNNDIEWPPLI